MRLERVAIILLDMCFRYWNNIGVASLLEQVLLRLQGPLGHIGKLDHRFVPSFFTRIVPFPIAFVAVMPFARSASLSAPPFAAPPTLDGGLYRLILDRSR